MEHVKELLRSRIEKIHDPVQKLLLQDVLMDVFMELLKYSDGQFLGLERRLEEEQENGLRQYGIYTGLCKKEGLDQTSRSLFEVQIPDEEQCRLQARGEGCLGTLFLACDYLAVRKCMQNTYPAKVKTDSGDFDTEVSLRLGRAYCRAVEWLYRQFLANQIPWHTVNCPFMYKFLDLVDSRHVVPQNACVEKVEISLGEFSPFIINDAVLVWNLQEEFCKPSVETVASLRTPVYVHEIPLEDSAAGYLAAPEEEDSFTVVYRKGALVLRTEKAAHDRVRLLKIPQMNVEKDYTGLLYPAQSNCQEAGIAYSQPRFVWTKGEVMRVLSSYDTFGEFELLDICLDMPGEVEQIDLNPFISSHSFLKHKRKLALVLHAKNGQDIFRYEKMFFLVAELQLYTHEYEWVGILK